MLQVTNECETIKYGSIMGSHHSDTEMALPAQSHAPLFGSP